MDLSRRETGSLILRTPVVAPGTEYATVGGALGGPEFIDCEGSPYCRYHGFTDDNCSIGFDVSINGTTWYTLRGRSVIGGTPFSNYTDAAPWNNNGWLLIPGKFCRLWCTNSAGVQAVLELYAFFSDR